MTNEQALDLFEGMKSEESLAALIEMCDVAIVALKFREHFDALKEFQHLEEVVRCKDCYYNLICSHSVTMTQYSQNTISTGPRDVEFCSYGKRRDDDGKK